MKNELGGKIMTNFVASRPITYSYLTDDNVDNKKKHRHKNVCHKTKT